MYKSFLSYIPSLLLGYLIVDAIWHTVNFRQSILKIFLGMGIGLGTTSLLFFLWLLLTNQLKGFEWLLAGIIIAGVLMKLYCHRNQPFRFRLPAISFTPAWISLALFIAFAGTSLFSYNSFILSALTHQHGDRDAQAIWNMHARIIYRDTANWKEVFSPEFDTRFHPDYPLLTPLNVVWGWSLLKTETTRIPIVLAGLFTFGTVGLSFASLINLKTWGQASLASLVLMGTSYFISLGTFQTADVPFTYFVLSTITLFALYSLEEKAGLLILAGLTAGLSAWTKNEGIFFILSSLIGCAIYGLTQQQFWRTLRLFATGLLAPAIIILFYKIALAPSNDLFIGFNIGEVIDKLTSLQRYETIFTAIGKSLLNFGGWQFSILIILAVFSMIIGLRLEGPQKKVAGICATILAIQLLGYIFIYVMTPLPLEFHLQYSLDRLLFQLFPATLFLFFWVVSAPENIIQYRLISDPQKSDQYASDH